MELEQIKIALESPDSPERLKAIAFLRPYPSETVVPLLLSRIEDHEFIVRSFVAMGLGYKQAQGSYEGLLQLLNDKDPNVRSEAVNSLALHGKEAISCLMKTFQEDDHWLVRRSIIASMATLDCPTEFYQLCLWGLEDHDPIIQEAAIEGLGFLKETEQAEQALDVILSLIHHESWRIRVQIARTLRQFDHPRVQETLSQLKQDQDHRVVAAVLEGLLSC